jgi:type I restriction enzyme, S subunit
VKAGWEVKSLGDALAVVRNGLNCKQSDDLQGAPISRIETIARGSFNFERVGRAQITEDQKAKYKLRQGDILFSHINSPPHVGKTAILKSTAELYHGVNLLLLRPEADIDRGYLEHYLKYLHSSGYWRSRCKQSVNQASVNQTDIKKVRFPKPPLAEQKRIVSILDDAFEGLDRARENAEANLKSARELFANLLNATFESNNEQWTHSNLGAACQFIGGSQPPKANFTLEDGEGLIRLVQIRDYKSDKNITFIPRTLARRFCTANDVMIGRYGPPLFQILRGIEGAYNVALMKAEPNPELLSKDYLYFFLRNGRILKYIIDASNRAAGQIGLNKATIEPYPISYPNLAEQSRIVAELEKAEVNCKSLETKYRTKLQDISDLRQSLLQKAFAGELT